MFADILCGGVGVGDDVDALDGRGADLEAEAGFAGADEDGEAPAAVGVLDHNDAVAVFDAEQEAGLELVDDDDGLGLAEDGGGNGGLGAVLEFLEDGFAGFDAVNEIGARSFGAHESGPKQGDEGEEQEFLHDDAKRLKWAPCRHGGPDLESAEWVRRCGRIPGPRQTNVK